MWLLVFCSRACLPWCSLPHSGGAPCALPSRGSRRPCPCPPPTSRPTRINCAPSSPLSFAGSRWRWTRPRTRQRRAAGRVQQTPCRDRRHQDRARGHQRSPAGEGQRQPGARADHPRRLPELEGRLKAAKEAMAKLKAANAELRNTAGSQAEALKLARSTLNTQRGDIDQLRGALEGEAVSSRRSRRNPTRHSPRKIANSTPSSPSSSKSSGTDGSAATRTACCARRSANSQVILPGEAARRGVADFSRLGASPPPAEQSPRPLWTPRA